MAEENVAWVGRQPLREPELIDPDTGRAPRSGVGRERARQAAAEAMAGTVTASAPPPDHTT